MHRGTVRPDSEKVRSLRLAKELTQEELSGRAGCSKKTIENIEKGKPCLPVMLGAVAGQLGTNLADLIAHSGWEDKRRVVLVRAFEDLLDWNVRIVTEAQKCLVTTGCRSRDAKYLKCIEDGLISNLHLIYYRILFGPPFMQLFKDHLGRLLEICPPTERPYGQKRVNIAIIRDMRRYPEVFICANESRGLVVQPSFSGTPGRYDSAVVYTSQREVEGLISLGQNLYSAGEPIESVAGIQSLEVLPGAYQYV